MKKIISTLLALIISFSSIIVLSSCENGETPNTDQSSTTDASNNGGQPPKNIRTTVTEQEWNKAISLDGISSFTLEFDQIGYKSSPENDKNHSVTFYYDNGIYMQAYKATLEVVHLESGEIEYITYDPYYEIVNEEITSFADMDIYRGDLFVDFFEYYLDKNLNFSSFTYNEETKSYDIEYVKKSNLPPFHIKFFFENGAFTKWTLNYHYTSAEHSEEYNISCHLYGWNETAIPYPRIVTDTYEGYIEALNEAQNAITSRPDINNSSNILQTLKSLFSTVEASGYLYESINEKDVTLVIPNGSIEFGEESIHYDRILIFSEIPDVTYDCLAIQINGSSLKPCFYMIFASSENM